MPTSCRRQVRMYVCMCAPHFRALFFGQAGAGSCHCRCCCRCHCSCRRRYLFPCCSHCCCFVLFLRYELLVVPLRTQISTHIHTHTVRDGGVACVCHKLFCSFKCIMATRTPLDSLCLLHAYAGVCVYEYVFVCVLACWKPQQSQCTPHPHTHTHTCCVIPVHKYLHMKFIMLKISQDLKARDRERVKRE